MLVANLLYLLSKFYVNNHVNKDEAHLEMVHSLNAVVSMNKSRIK